MASNTHERNLEKIHEARLKWITERCVKQRLLRREISQEEAVSLLNISKTDLFSFMERENIPKDENEFNCLACGKVYRLPADRLLDDAPFCLNCSERPVYAFLDVLLDDFDAAVILMQKNLYPQAVFLASQAAEKAIKALLVSISSEMTPSHSLQDLLWELKRTVGEDGRFIKNIFGDNAVKLAYFIDTYTGHAKTFPRYPGRRIRRLKHHPLFSFNEYIATGIIATSVLFINNAWSYLAREAQIQGANKQACYACSSQVRPIYICVRCLRWLCMECGTCHCKKVTVVSCGYCIDSVNEWVEAGEYSEEIPWRMVYPYWEDKNSPMQLIEKGRKDRNVANSLRKLSFVNAGKKAD